MPHVLAVVLAQTNEERPRTSTDGKARTVGRVVRAPRQRVARGHVHVARPDGAGVFARVDAHLVVASLGRELRRGCDECRVRTHDTRLVAAVVARRAASVVDAKPACRIGVELGDARAAENRAGRTFHMHAAREGQRSRETGERGEAWGDVERRGETMGDAGRCGEAWGDVGRCGEVWGDVGRRGEMWEDVGRCGEIAHLMTEKSHPSGTGGGMLGGAM